MRREKSIITYTFYIGIFFAFLQLFFIPFFLPHYENENSRAFLRGNHNKQNDPFIYFWEKNENKKKQINEPKKNKSKISTNWLILAKGQSKEQLDELHRIFHNSAIDAGEEENLGKDISVAPNEVFRCDEGRTKLTVNYINDNYCDCEDGTDERGTSACSGLNSLNSKINKVESFFTCSKTKEIKGIEFNHKIKAETQTQTEYKKISSSKVNDGICDCCTGEDEWETIEKGLISCPNTC